MLRSAKLWALALMLALAGCRAAGDRNPAANSVPKSLMAGAGEALINLPVGHSTAGYAQTSVLAFKFPENDPGSPFADLFPASTGVLGPPKAKVVLFDNGAALLAIAKIDAIATTDVLVERTVQLAKTSLGLDLRGKLILSATHSHAAGSRFATSLRVKLLDNQEGWRRDAIGHGLDSFNPESVERVAVSIVEAIREAQANMRPAALGYAKGKSDEGGHDRRCVDNTLYGEGNIDQAVRVIRVDETDADGKSVAPIAVLVNFAMHGTINGAYNHHLSVDAPGFVETKLEERFHKKVSVLYLQGSAGDVSPGGQGSGSQRMEDVGYRVADEAYRLYRAVTEAAESETVTRLSRIIPIRTVTRRIPISHKLLEYPQGEFHEDGAILCLIGHEDCPAVPAAPGGVACVGKGLPGEGKYHTDLAAAQLGPLTLATLPGEPVSEVGRQLLKAAKAAGAGETLVLGYAQDHNGYILMPDDWLLAGYEPTISYWGWRFAPYLIAQQGDVIRELVTGQAHNKLATPKYKYPDLEFTPVTPAASKSKPAFTVQPPSGDATRLSELKISWIGGDPALGMPKVTVEQVSGGVSKPLLQNSWRDVNNFGSEIVTDYAAEPSYKASKSAKTREHTWTATWGIPAWVSAGSYQIRVTGRRVSSPGAEAEDYKLVSDLLTIAPATNLVMGQSCDADGDGQPETSQDYFGVTSDATGLHVRMAAFYTQSAPVWDDVYNHGDHQLGNYRLWSERGTAAFPLAAPLSGKIRIMLDSGGGYVKTGDIDLVRAATVGTAKVPALCLSDDTLPRSEGSFVWGATGSYRVEFDTGDVTDTYGNAVSGAVSAVYVH